jgi:signal transduction histidine kinase
LYAATGGGLSVIPAAVNIASFDIPVKLIRMRINQEDALISNAYDLSYREGSIEMQFAAIELDGHFRNLQYTLDTSKGWVNLRDNILALQLNSGDHKVYLRAVDVNGYVSRAILVITFDISTPFWRNGWFWLAVALLVQVPLVYLVNRWQKKKKENRLALEVARVQTASLEQQAFTSLLNPHFMFNALNSIQHYINKQDRRNANRYLSDFASLIRKNFEAAQRSFISLDQELENLKIYLRLEQMRFGDRFTYEITGDDRVETDNWMIPTMMLQPLLENAILHGIMPLSTPGHVRIGISTGDDYLQIAITDNGIGVENSLALKKQQTHKSHGMLLIRKRIKALNNFTGAAITMEMHPASDNPQYPGNRTVLTIPADLYDTWAAVERV